MVLVLAAATVAMARAKERKTLENDGKGRESTTRGTGQKASHAQTPTHAAHAAQHPHSQQRECEKRRTHDTRAIRHAIRHSPFAYY